MNIIFVECYDKSRHTSGDSDVSFSLNNWAMFLDRGSLTDIYNVSSGGSRGELWGGG